MTINIESFVYYYYANMMFCEDFDYAAMVFTPAKTTSPRDVKFMPKRDYLKGVERNWIDVVAKCGVTTNGLQCEKESEPLRPSVAKQFLSGPWSSACAKKHMWICKSCSK